MFTRLSLLVVAAGVFLSSCTQVKPLISLSKKEEVVMPQVGGFDITVAQLDEQCKRQVDGLTAVAEKISNIAAADAKFANTAGELRRASAPFENAIMNLTLLGYVGASGEIQDAGHNCESLSSKAKVSIYSSTKLYQVLKAALDKKEKLDAEDTFLLNYLLAELERRGGALDAATLAQVNERQNKIVDFSEKFNKKLEGDAGKVELVDEAELAGVDPNLIQSLKSKGTDPATGKIKVPLRQSILTPIMENATNEDLRKRLQTASLSIGGKDNEENLENLFTLRQEVATLMGFPNYAAYVIKQNLAADPQKVTDFLTTTANKLQAKNQERVNQLLELKKNEVGPASQLNSWDNGYYRNQLKKKVLNFDQASVGEYFPVNVVMKGMFGIYEKMLSVQFEEVPNAPVWDPLVKLYRVKKEGKTIAFFYTDFYPRPGKYQHFAAFDLNMAFQDANGVRQLPVSAIVGNFPPPSDGKPSLLRHSDVKTMFHEFGHIMPMSHISSKYRYFEQAATYSGTLTKIDFIEAPSQMLEHWVWEAETLNQLSGHYADNSKKLPMETIQKLVGMKEFDEDAPYLLRQIALASIDIAFHSQANAAPGDSTKLYYQKFKEIVGVDLPPGAYPHASWGHMVGYEASYYSYLWSKTLAEDMYTRFKAQGLVNPIVGADYVNFILAPGLTQGPTEMVTKFLGRAPNLDAFYLNMGVTP